MSSEDSEVEDQLEVVLRVHAMPWRREMGNELEYIDSQRIMDREIFGRQGMRPMKRIRGQGRVSTRKSVEGLPSTLYNPAWLNSDLARGVRLKVARTPFAWMRCIWAEDVDDGELADNE